MNIRFCQSFDFIGMLWMMFKCGVAQFGSDTISLEAQIFLFGAGQTQCNQHTRCVKLSMFVLIQEFNQRAICTTNQKKKVTAMVSIMNLNRLEFSYGNTRDRASISYNSQLNASNACAGNGVGLVVVRVLCTPSVAAIRLVT